jgi:hypothetical protein
MPQRGLKRVLLLRRPPQTLAAARQSSPVTALLLRRRRRLTLLWASGGVLLAATQLRLQYQQQGQRLQQYLSVGTSLVCWVPSRKPAPAQVPTHIMRLQQQAVTVAVLRQQRQHMRTMMLAVIPWTRPSI